MHAFVSCYRTRRLSKEGQLFNVAITLLLLYIATIIVFAEKVDTVFATYGGHVLGSIPVSR